MRWEHTNAQPIPCCNLNFWSINCWCILWIIHCLAFPVYVFLAYYMWIFFTDCTQEYTDIVQYICVFCVSDVYFRIQIYSYILRSTFVFADILMIWAHGLNVGCILHRHPKCQNHTMFGKIDDLVACFACFVYDMICMYWCTYRCIILMNGAHG